jgi:hypothetical protein
MTREQQKANKYKLRVIHVQKGIVFFLQTRNADTWTESYRSVDLLSLVERFVVPVQKNLTDWGLCVPTTFTPVHE